jgi:GxxExxY protein
MTGGTTREFAGLVHGELTHGIIGAFYEIYRRLGYGYFEAVYQRALPIELAFRGLKAEREVPLTVRYRGELVGEYRADLIVEGKVIVETKAGERIIQAHEMQLLNYLSTTGLRVGLILNFGPRPSFRRLLL